MEWRVHPAKDRPLMTVLVTIFLTGCCIFVEWYGGSMFLTVVGIVVLFGSLRTYYLPSEYRLDAEGVEVRRLLGSQKREWKAFRYFYGTNRGIQLSTFPEPSWLDSYRGVFLVLRNNREEVEKYIRRRIGSANEENAGDETREN